MIDREANRLHHHHQDLVQVAGLGPGHPQDIYLAHSLDHLLGQGHFLVNVHCPHLDLDLEQVQDQDQGHQIPNCK